MAIDNFENRGAEVMIPRQKGSQVALFGVESIQYHLGVLFRGDDVTLNDNIIKENLLLLGGPPLEPEVVQSFKLLPYIATYRRKNAKPHPNFGRQDPYHLRSHTRHEWMPRPMIDGMKRRAVNGSANVRCRS